MVDQIVITGNIGKDPELRYTPNGKAVVSFSVGNTPRRLNQASQQWEDGITVWDRVEAWDSLAENAGKSLVKGASVIIVGERVTEEYNDRTTGEKRTSTKIRANNIGASFKNAVATIQRVQRTDSGAPRSNNAARPAVSDESTETPF